MIVYTWPVSTVNKIAMLTTLLIAYKFHLLFFLGKQYFVGVLFCYVLSDQ